MIYREIADNCRFEAQSCLKVQPERRKKEVKRKPNRELTTVRLLSFFLTFSMKRKLFDELLWMAFEFFLATRGAEVVCFSFKIYPEFCRFFVKHSAANIIA